MCIINVKPASKKTGIGYAVGRKFKSRKGFVGFFTLPKRSYMIGKEYAAKEEIRNGAAELRTDYGFHIFKSKKAAKLYMLGRISTNSVLLKVKYSDAFLEGNIDDIAYFCWPDSIRWYKINNKNVVLAKKRTIIKSYN